MKVTQRGLDRAVAHQSLDGVKIDAVLQQMGSKGMAQAVDAARLTDIGLALGQMENPRRRLALDRQAGPDTGEEPS